MTSQEEKAYQNQIREEENDGQESSQGLNYDESQIL